MKCRQSVHVARAENDEFSVTFFPGLNGSERDGEKKIHQVLL